MKIRNDSLTEGSIFKGLIYFAVPIMLTNLLQQLYNAVDSSVVGIYAGSESLAAVGSTGALINLLVGFFLGIATGTGVLFSQYYGANDKKNLSNIMGTAVILSLLCGVVVTVFGIIFAEDMLIMVNTPSDVIDLSTKYLKVFCIGIIPMIFYNVGAGIIRSCGDSKHPLYYLVISGVVNVILDIVFVAILKKGVAGAAAATVIAQFISAGLVLINLIRIPDIYSLRRKNLHIYKETARDIIKVSIPCGLQSSMFGISNMLVQIKINNFGSAAMAGCAAYEKVDMFSYVPVMALSLAISTFVGQNIGAKNFGRIKKGVRICLFTSIIVTICLNIINVSNRDLFLSAFTSDSEAKIFAITMMFTLAPFSWIHSFTEILGGAIRGAGASFQVMIIITINICLIRILWISVTLSISNNIRVLSLCYPVSWILCATCFIIYYRRGKWLNNKRITEY